MAGRFVLLKFSSETSRSMSFLAARPSASSRAAAPAVSRSSEAGIKTLNNVFHGAADHPGTAVTCASEAGIRTGSNVLHGDAVHPGTAILIHGNAARCFNTVPCSLTAGKTGWSTTRLRSDVSNRRKPAFMNSVGGVRQTSSSSSSNGHGHSWEAIVEAWRARRAWLAEKIEEEVFDKSTRNVGLMSTFIAFCLITWPAPSDHNGKTNFRACSGCCSCLSGASKS